MPLQSQGHSANDGRGPRYAATVAVGCRLEPWLTEELLPPPPSVR